MSPVYKAAILFGAIPAAIIWAVFKFEPALYVFGAVGVLGAIDAFKFVTGKTGNG
jgi:hypothetical protein